jgi:hypothetical protein
MICSYSAAHTGGCSSLSSMAVNAGESMSFAVGALSRRVYAVFKGPASL